MAERRLFLDAGIGESRAVVTLGARPERLIIVRDGAAAVQALGARSIARVRRIERASALAFLELENGPDGVLNLTPGTDRLVEGQMVEVEVRSEARRNKGAAVRLLGPAEGPSRFLAAASDVQDQLIAFAPGVAVETGASARSAADAAQREALEIGFDLPGGGRIVVEPTEALVAIDVDLRERPGVSAKQAARAANFAALGLAARVLRLKGLGGLIVIDLIGRNHDAPALLAAARAAFAPDNPGVAFAPVSRFGALELAIPRRRVPSLEILADTKGRPTAATIALDLIRRLEREAAIDGGAQVRGYAAPEVAEAAAPALAILASRVGGRVRIVADPARERCSFEVTRS
ncbi:MAG: ribonuclease E/G [Caulobacteraceae bacterium]